MPPAPERATAFAYVADDELVLRAQSGDVEAVEAILERYRRYAGIKARGYFLIGADSEDVRQEALIGIFKAIRDFQAERGVPFRAFAEVCVSRQIITAVKAASRKKHQPLNRAASVHAQRDDDSTTDYDFEDPSCVNPESEVIRREEAHELASMLAAHLSPMERQILRLYVECRSYEQVAARLGYHTKAVDNALYRIKRKMAARHCPGGAAMPTARQGVHTHS